MCLVSRPMKIVTFLRKNGDLPKRVVVDFLRERDTFRKNHGNRRGFRRKKLQQLVNPGNRRGFCVRSQISSFFIVHYFFIFSFSSFFFIFSFFLFLFSISTNHFFEPSRKVPLWALFSFFSSFLFFKKKILFELLIFLFLFFFLKKKVSSFLFS